MFINVVGNYYAVPGENNYVVFNAYRGEPVVVNSNFFNRLINNTLNKQDKKLIKANGLNFNSDPEEEKIDHQKSIDSYVNAYPGPAVLDLMVSEICNLNCGMCIHGYARKSLASKKQTLMNWDNIKAWIDYYVQEWAPGVNLNVLSFHFGVAEPLINKLNLQRAIAYINQIPTDLPKEVMINTNLTLLDNVTFSLFKKYPVFINVGLDGGKKSNDATRIDHHGMGTFELILQNIKILRAAGVHVGVAITLTNQNFYLIKPKSFLKLMKSLKINSVLVDPDLVQGLKCPPNVLVEKLMSFQKIGDQLGIEIRGDWRAPFENLISVSDEPAGFCASIMGKNISVSPSGKLLFCCYSSKVIATDQINPIGAFQTFKTNMQNYMGEYWHNINHEKCLNCPLVGLCSGGCHITREQHVGVDYMCAVYKQATYSLLQYFYGQEKC